MALSSSLKPGNVRRYVTRLDAFLINKINNMGLCC